MTVEKDDVILTLNLDESDDIELIPNYIKSAEIFIKNAVGGDDKFYSKENVTYLYDTAVLSLASTYYTYRIALSDTTTYPIDLTVNSIIGQLRGLYSIYSEGEIN
ncbi:hypothetical protein HMPREF9318_00092 [Streptococcus urinalis FB127-CNA-2]|uniref:DNA packaging protein, QLRG family n=1 Tax=Streptococcus urinalis 2285-97 TaxID=764291 RepID=G5KEJ6_9STRE|nr:head-tail connector protein [Streptococcus urinalis]QBX22154.1 DNA packaging protein [Streptococcus phage Javan637]QBX31610.1 DNA packaging protein [Streptococcus phage Javan642]QBX31645.1 DNA packaging protein [Streptococcus phage Javan648]EHJ57123.1 DNA packaging protein, QLRG family [Streptococcus urinalis 2285-97]EKS21894.1 hypothetical protein HMPREF9318_00092 [Streptococcus urinalis FB127-CNA-2]